MNLQQRLLEVKKELPKLKPDATGRQGNRKFKYVSLEAIQDVLDPILSKHEVFVYFQNKEDESKVYIIMTVADNETSYSLGYEFEKDNKQINPIMNSGSSLTYGIRYALSAFFRIPMGDIDPNQNAKEEAAKKYITKIQIKNIFAEFEKLSLNPKDHKDEFLSKMGVDETGMILKENYTDALKAVEEIAGMK